MSRLNARSVSLLAGRGVEWDPRLCVSGFRRPGRYAHRTLTSFYLRAGAAARSTPRPTLSHPPSAPGRRRCLSLWACPGSIGSCGFSGIVQSPLLFVRWRHRPLEGWCVYVAGSRTRWGAGGSGYQSVWGSGRPDLHPGGSFPNRVTFRKSHHLSKALLMAVKPHKNFLTSN